MYNCPKCGKEVKAPKDLSIRSARCSCGNLVAFSDAVTMLPQASSQKPSSKQSSGEIIIPGYRIARKIGEGGMGSVYEAIQESLDRKVAVKILPGNLANDQQFVKRFEREAGALSQLRHPNIVGIIDKGTVDGTYFFIMEYVADKNGDNTTLEDLMRQQKLAAHNILKITKEIANALAYAHSKGIIHRDIKPSNILIDELSSAKVVDFGIAQILGDEQNRKIHLTLTGEAIGTPQYMAPEQKTNASKVDARSDIYSLGVMVYQMLTGDFPEGAWELPSELGYDSKWDSLIENSIKKLPERRFQVMTDFLSALDAIGTEPPAPKETSASADKPKEERYRTPVPPTSILGKCTSCGVENSGDNRFCNGCGASLYEPCPSCQGEIRVGLKFCGKCGVDIPKQKIINDLKSSIAKTLEEATAKKDDIVSATEILLNAIPIEEQLIKLSGTLKGTIQPPAIHDALNSLWDEKAVASDIFPTSGTKHIEFLNRILKVLPDHQDIKAKIGKLHFEKERFLKDLKKLFSDGQFLTIMQAVSNSKWSDSPEFTAIVSDSQERFTKANNLIDSHVPELISKKKYYQLMSALLELEGLGIAIEGLDDLRKETSSNIEKSKELYNQALKLISSNNPIKATETLGILLNICSDYPDALELMGKIKHQISKYNKIIVEAEACMKSKNYRMAVNILTPILFKYDLDELKVIYKEAVNGSEMMFRRKVRFAVFISLSAISVIFVFILIKWHLDAQTFNSYFENAKTALEVKDHEKAIDQCKKALKVPGNEDHASAMKLLEDAQLGLEHKIHYNTLMEDGKRRLDNKDWANAHKIFLDALKVPGYENDEEAKYNMMKCEEHLTEYKKKNDTTFRNLVLEGSKALSDKEYAKALKFFDEALKVPGYEKNDAIIKQREQAILSLERKSQFDKYMSEGNEAFENKDWENAKKAYGTALLVPGYESSIEASDKLNKCEQKLTNIIKNEDDFKKAIYLLHRRQATSAYEILKGVEDEKKPYALAIIGNMSRLGYGVKQDNAIAKTYLEEAAKTNHPLGYFGLARLATTSSDKINAEKYFKDAITNGLEKLVDTDSISAMATGYCYQYALGGLVKNEKKAFELFAKSADLENPFGQLNLGFCYLEGTGVQKDERKAFELFNKASHQGLIQAKFQLGLCYENGIGVEKDGQKAFNCYSEAAAQDDIEAQASLGCCYFLGIGTKRDVKKAVEWFTKAAEKGDPLAQNNLGVCYENGYGIQLDNAKAVFWYTKAAEKGQSNAQYKLGLCYLQGNGIRRDEKKAIEWLQKSADQGNEDAKRVLKDLNNRSQEFKTNSTNETNNFPAADSKNNLISLGSTQETVKKIMGLPTSMSADSWEYGYSIIYLDSQGKVRGWANISKNLKVSIGEKKSNALPITLGSSQQDVINAMGTPTNISTGSWEYDFSIIYFDSQGKVRGWANISKNLKVSIGEKKSNAPPISLGSSQQDVINAMGTPTNISTGSWEYDYSIIYFDSQGKVRSWSDISKNLKVK